MASPRSSSSSAQPQAHVPSSTSSSSPGAFSGAAAGYDSVVLREVGDLGGLVRWKGGRNGWGGYEDAEEEEDGEEEVCGGGVEEGGAFGGGG